jgi:hypothetical protein
LVGRGIWSFSLPYKSLWDWHVSTASLASAATRFSGGDPIFWFGNEKYQYGPWLYISENEPITVREAVNWALKHRFDYAVRKTTTPIGTERPPRLMPDFHTGKLCDHLCRIFGTKVDEFYDPYYGPIEIYRLDWNQPLRNRR